MRSTRRPSRWCAASWRTPRTGCGWIRCRSTRAPCPRTSCTQRLDGADPRRTARHPDEVLGVYSSVIAPERHLRRQPAVPRVHPGRPDQGQPALRHARVLRLDPGDLLAGGVRRDRGGEHRAAADRRRGRAARRRRRLLRLRRVGRQPVRLAVARETAKKRLGADAARPAAARRRRHRRALLDREHPAPAGDGRARGRHARPPAHRRDRPRRGRGRGRPVRHRRGGVHLRHDQRRHHRRPRRRRRARPRARLVVPRRRRVRRIGHLRPLAAAEVRRASSRPTRSSSTRTSGCSRRSTAARCSIASPSWRAPHTPRTRRTSTSSTSPTASGTRPTTPTT